MTPAEQAEVLDLLDVRVTLLGDVPSRKSKDDQVAQWFRANGGVVPTLTDEAWAKAETVFTGPSAGRPTRPPRLMLEALLHKAVSRCSWRETGEQYGPWATVASTWRRWSERGVWAAGMELLAGMPGTPIPPEEITLPPIRVEGRLDPRLLVSTREPSVEGFPCGSPIRGLFREQWVTSDPQCERTWEKRSLGGGQIV
ncbi:transposase [Streptomyces sp. NPDC058220]|uniref:transposase n=1 Tax=unclassified Streptomyces TaxID=2593676 RepID=UPI00364B6ABD